MSRPQNTYQLLDAGYGRKLERFGQYVLSRPCAQAIWRPALSEEVWNRADASFTRENRGGWTFRRPEMRQGWRCSLAGVTFLLKPTDFGHVGIFPEHHIGWKMIGRSAASASTPLRVLNLFAYSGGATLASAAAGCEVCHLDASKKMVDWARDNAALNGLDKAPIRWIVDDVFKFVQREIRRGRKYDGIILDPPSFGRGTNQELFQIDNSILELLDSCRKLLSDTPEFILLSCHTPGYTPTVLEHLVGQTLPEARCYSGEMLLPAEGGVLPVPCGAYACWSTREYDFT